jgi:glycyl-tRNA synthetase beta chain
MAAGKEADFLVEIGTEELPPKALRKLMQAFAANLGRLLDEQRLAHGAIKAFASPRRIAAVVSQLATAQVDREVDAKGPPVKIAFDENGEPRPPAIAFAKKCGVGVQDLARTKTDKGEWLSYQSVEKGAAAAELLPALIEQVLQALPIPRRMRWGTSNTEFVRPVHWVVMLHGKKVVPGTVMGHTAGNLTRGHRFMAPGELKIPEPSKYAALLRDKGFVLADFDARQEKIVRDVTAAATAAGGAVASGSELFEEVAALTEWPVAMTGHFDEAFLSLPAEAIVASLTSHQRYFPIADASGKLLAAFVVVANLDSTDPARVLDGNERVLRPRLADAVFFWDTDRKRTLARRIPDLARVVYQKGLGSLKDKSERVASLGETLANDLGVDQDATSRAARLAKCDLLTGMVGEFPELQGIMGGYYANADDEPAGVASAIREQYLPRFAGDELPASAAGQVLALADKLDTLAGVFALGKKPTGSKDPFGLRRAALGVVRILIECELELGLQQAVVAAVKLQPTDDIDEGAVARELHGFIRDRLRSFYVEQADVSAEIFEAVDKTPDQDNTPLVDFDQRIAAVKAFAQMTEAASLAAANKRISNILQQAAAGNDAEVQESLLLEEAEVDLYAALREAMRAVEPLQGARDYAAVLTRLALLKDPVDRFFDEVMVMAEDEDLKQNRLALLARLREPFRSVADISRLSAAKSGGG